MGAYITSFEVPEALANEIRSSAVPQAQGKAYPNSPQRVDPTKSKDAYGLPKNWIDKIRKQAIPGTGKIQTPNH